MKKISNIFFALFTVFTSCEQILPCKDQNFTINKTANSSNKLKLDGFYYDTVLSSNRYSLVYLFFSNGIFYNRNLTEIENIENNKVYFPPNINEYKTFWGIYRIFGDSIEIQFWGEKYSNCYKVIKQKGKIINDSCFIIDKKTDYHSNWIDEYHFFVFKQFSPKPDSVISFIP